MLFMENIRKSEVGPNVYFAIIQHDSNVLKRVQNKQYMKHIFAGIGSRVFFKNIFFFTFFL